MKRITRSAPVDGNLVKIKTPTFLSLVGKPANQRPFPVIRSEPPTKNGKRIARTKRGDSAVIMILFPVEYDLEDAEQIMVEFGMTDYTLEVVDGTICAYRSDLQSVAKAKETETHPIKITRDGITAMVDAGQYEPKKAVRSGGRVSVSAIEFDAKRFDSEKIIAWGQQNGVDFSKDAIENSSADVFSVSRKAVSDEIEVRRMQVEEGVTFAVYRDDDPLEENGEGVLSSIPAGFVAVVNEAAYGNWGWGQLDFAASLADIDFCDALCDAQYRVQDVMYRILFYSELPLETRKQLVTRCLQQYGEFVNEAIDSLPRQVLLLAGAAVARADASSERVTPFKREDIAMKIDPVAAQKELDAIEAKRAADKAVADKAAEEAQRAAAKTPAADAEDAKDGGKDDAEEDANGNKKAKTSDEAPVTRAELAGLIASAVVEAMKQNSAPVVAAPAAAEQAAPAVAAAPAAAAAPASITREDLTAALADVLKPVTERLERIEGTTVVRSAGNDGEPAKAEPAKTEQNVFRGAFGNLGAAPKE